MARNHKVDAIKVLERVKQVGASLYVSRGEAAALLEHLGADLNPKLDRYERRKRISTTMDRAPREGTEPGRKPPLQRRADGSVNIGDLARWARLQYGLPFKDLPSGPPKTIVDLVKVKALARSSGNDLALPEDVEKCHLFIRSLLEENKRLRGELQSFPERQRQELVARLGKGNRQPEVERPSELWTSTFASLAEQGAAPIGRVGEGSPSLLRRRSRWFRIRLRCRAKTSSRDPRFTSREHTGCRFGASPTGLSGSARESSE